MLRTGSSRCVRPTLHLTHYDRHLLSCVRHLGEKDGIHHVEAAFAVYQTSTEGVTRLFSVGKYVDRIVRRGDRFLFADKTVVVDTAAVPTLLATPI